MAEPENKLTVQATVEFILKFQQEVYRFGGKMSLRFLEEARKSEFVTFTMENFSPFFEEYAKQIKLLIEAGINPAKTDLRKTLNFFRTRNLERDLPELVLSLENLSIGFLVCLVPLSLSFVVFLCELAVPKTKSLATKIRDVLGIFFFVQSLTRAKIGLF